MQNLEKEIRSIQNDSQMPGLQVVVTEGDTEIFNYSHGVRSVSHSNQITNQDKWHIGSCTKPMTAFLIGMLIDQNRLNWNTKLEEILPQNQKIHDSLKKITIEQLLSHYSGLADVTEPNDGKLWNTLFTFEKSSKEMRSLLASGILELPAKHPPGAKFEYSNSGYVILGWVTEQFWNSDWENIVTQEIFKKLKMNSCGFGSPGIDNTSTPSQPWGHELKGNQLIPLPPGVQSDNPPALGPAGTVHCNVSDWQKFISLFLNHEPETLLSKKTLEKLKSPVDLSSQNTYKTTYASLGRMERDWSKGTVYTMAGSNTYNYALMIVAPNLNRMYTINTNAGHAKAEAGTVKILKALTLIPD